MSFSDGSKGKCQRCPAQPAVVSVEEAYSQGADANAHRGAAARHSAIGKKKGIKG